MANPTTAFGWVMPNSADLVTDLPADFAVFGQGVDTSMQYLLGGTTGQVLSKTSGTNMAFTWINNDTGDITGVTAGTGISGGGTSGTVTVTNDMATTITTNGDLLYGTGSGTYTRRAIGSTGNVLTVAGGIPTWAAPTGGGKVLQVVSATTSTTTLSTSTTYANTNLTASITPTLNTSKVLIMLTVPEVYKSGVASSAVGMRITRGATSINQFAALTNSTGTTSDLFMTVSANYLDSPATTSSTTYTLQIKSNVASNQVGVIDNPNSVGSIILMEIGA